MKKLLFFLGIIVLILSLWGIWSESMKAKESKGELVIFAASSLSDAFLELKEKFELQNPEVNIYINFASSGKLQIQIEQGAPADIFASAGIKQMNALTEKGFMANPTNYFAKNRLVVIGPKDSQLKLNDLKDFLQEEIDEIGLGDPQTTPVGQYSADAINNLDLWESLQSKLIYGNNVRQVLQYVERGEVGLGFVYATDAAISEQVKVLYTIPEKSHNAILYPIGITKGSENIGLAAKFTEWVLSDVGQTILARYGFEKGQ